VQSDLNSLEKRSTGLEAPVMCEMETSFKSLAARTAFSRMLTCRIPLVLEELEQSTAPQLSL
jgi:hypothetical protein